MKKICTVLNCQNTYYSKGYCKQHYDKNRRQGDPMFKRKLDKDNPCKVPGCLSKVWARTMCQKHYRNWERHGDPTFINPKCNRNQKWTKERAYANTAKWKQINKKEYNAYLAASKEKTRQATPKWLDSKLLCVIYKNCPDGYQVDHIVPITNKNVSGLNVPWNLQYLTAFENNSKNNKFDGTYQNETWRKDLPKV